jgi:hypothetical protein
MLAVALAVWAVKLIRHRPPSPWWLRLLLLPASLLAASIGLGLVPWSGAWPFTVSLGGALGQLLFGGGTLMGLLPMGLAPVWLLQLVCLVLALPLYYFALGVSWRRYHQAGKAIAAASGDLDPHQRHRPVAPPRRSRRPGAERYEEARRMGPPRRHTAEDEEEPASSLMPPVTPEPPARGGPVEAEPLVEPQKRRPQRQTAVKAGQATLDLVPNAEYPCRRWICCIRRLDRGAQR